MIGEYIKSGSHISKAINLLLLASLASIYLQKNGVQTFGILLSLVCLCGYLSQLTAGSKFFQSRDHTRGIAIFIIFPLLSIATIFLDPASSLSDFDSPSRSLLALFIFLWGSRFGLSRHHYAFGLYLGTLLAATVAIYETTTKDVYGVDLYFGSQSFGSMALAMGIFSLFNKNSNSKILSSIYLRTFIFFCGITASILSQSRAGWIVIPIILVLWYFYELRTLSANSKRKVFIGIGLVALTITLSFGETIASRLLPIKNEVLCSFSDTDKCNLGSAGIRLELYSGGWSAISQSPLGHGYDTRVVIQDLITSNKIRDVGEFNNFHNEWIQLTVIHGATGAIASLIFFSLIMKFAVTFINDKSSGHRYDSGFTLIAWIACLSVFGITQINLDRASTASFFYFSLAILLSFGFSSRLSCNRIEKS